MAKIVKIENKCAEIVVGFAFFHRKQYKGTYRNRVPLKAMFNRKSVTLLSRAHRV